MSDTAKLPPYSEKAPSTETSTPTTPPSTDDRIGGAVYTCSIRDLQVDYLSITRTSPTSYNISLTIDPTPLYRVETAADPTKIGSIQIFSASNPDYPVAAARIPSNPKKNEPVATLCTSSPHLPNSQWEALTRSGGTFSVDDYAVLMPLVTIPGRTPTKYQFAWRTTLPKPLYQLLWNQGPLPLTPSSANPDDQRGSDRTFAMVSKGESVIEMRRGGGLAFELSVVLGFFVILGLRKEQLP
jgi:hypothetical protein